MPAGASYVAAIQGIVSSLGSPTPIQVSIQPDPGKVVPAALGWEAGVTRLAAINQLLGAINYFPAWWDDLTLRSSPIPEWNTVTSSATFDCTQGQSIVRQPIKRKPDLSKVFNQALVRVEDPRRAPAFYGFYQNLDPTSPISVPKWHPKLAPIVTDSTIADQATANAAARTIVQTSARLYVPFEFDTFAWPASQDNDVYQLTFASHDEPLSSLLYVETEWVHRCNPGDPTTHTMTQIVRS